MHYAARNNPPSLSSSFVDMEGSYGPNNGMDGSGEFGTPPISSSLPKTIGGAGRPANSSASASPATNQGPSIKYFFNDDVVKHRLRVSQSDLTVSKFSALIRQGHKLPGDDFAIFSYEVADNKLHVVKESSPIRDDDVYYVIENSKLDKIYKRVEDRVKKNATMAMSDTKGRSVWTSDNNPMKVDFIPETEILMNQMGRIGLCMAPGRKKKKAHHDWDRDLDKDLDRIQSAYNCNVFVSLIRNSEMVALKIPHLFQEVEKRGMESIHFPIKDKWIPNSMDGLIALVDTLIQRLKAGKTIIIHCNGGKGRSATVAVAILIGLGKKVQNSIEVVRKARSGTIRNPLQILYVKRFKKAWKAFQKKRLSKNGGKESDTDTDVTDSEEEDYSVEEGDPFKHDDGDDVSGAEADKREAKRKKQEEEKRVKDAKKQAEKEKEEAKKKEKEAKKEEEKRKEEAKKEEEKRKKEEKQLKKDEEKQRKLDDQIPASSAAATPGKPDEPKAAKPESTPKPDKRRTTDSIDSGGDTTSGAELSREKKTFTKKGKEDEPKDKKGNKDAKTPLKVDVEAVSTTSAPVSPDSEPPTSPSRSRRKLTVDEDHPLLAEAGASEPAAAPREGEHDRKKKRVSVEPPAESATPVSAN